MRRMPIVAWRSELWLCHWRTLCDEPTEICRVSAGFLAVVHSPYLRTIATNHLQYKECASATHVPLRFLLNADFGTLSSPGGGSKLGYSSTLFTWEFAPLTLALAQAQAVCTPLLTETVQPVHHSTLIVHYTDVLLTVRDGWVGAECCDGNTELTALKNKKGLQG